LLRLAKASQKSRTFSDNITGNLSLTGDVDIQGDIINDLSLSGNITVQQSLSVVGTAMFANTASFGATVESVVPLTGATGLVVHDLSLGSTFFHKLPVSNFDVDITNVPAQSNQATVVCVCIEQGDTAYLPSNISIDGITQTIKWAGSQAPTGNASKIDIISLSMIKVDDTWRVLGQNSYFG
jgi:hypothetical protein